MKTSTPGVETILAQAVEIAAPAQRQAFVEQACAGDAALQSRVERLVANHFQAGNFLERPVVVCNPDGTDGWQTTADANGAGTSIGPYKLLEQIGEGGMGLVYVAEQQHPIRRLVALKIIKPGMDSRQVVARFEAERQALAMMEHANIAKVHDAGTTAEGRPYFVMELVKGTPITDYFDTHRLDTRQRLELFLDVCHAVQHAHQKGIIHRDLKPSNVLVSHHDVRAVVKVIDFGIAKATGQRLTDRSIYTGFAQMIGTPLYMSPEQAGLSDLDVDTRSDVYSLGVILYELLTGTTPFDDDTLKKAGYDEMRRIIREDEPLRPSTRLSTMQQAHLSTIAERRRQEPRRLGQQVRGELDWIVMKALEKDRSRRYESASALAADVQRYLNDEPVEACSPSVGYRLRKIVWRNRRVLAMVGVVAGVLVAATAVSMWQAVIARAAQHQAEAAESRAATKAAIAKAVNEFLQQDLLGQAASAPENGEFAENPYLTVKEAVDRAADRIGQRFQDQPIVEAAIRMAIASAYSGLGENPLAIPHLEVAVKLRKAHLGPNHADTLFSMCALAWSYQWNARGHDAIALYQHVLETRKAQLGPDHPDTLAVIDGLARAYRWAGQWDVSTQLFEELLEKRRALNGPAHPASFGAMHMLAMNYGHVGRIAEAVALYDKIFEHARATNERDGPLMTFAELCRHTGKFKQSEDLLREALQRQMDRKLPDSLGSRQGKANIYAQLALSLVLQQQYTEEAEQLARESLAISETVPLLKARPHWSKSVLGAVLVGQERYAEAEPLLLQSYEQFRHQEVLLADGEKYRARQIVEWIVRLYEATDQPKKAGEWREKLKAEKSKK